MPTPEEQAEIDAANEADKIWREMEEAETGKPVAATDDENARLAAIENDPAWEGAEEEPAAATPAAVTEPGAPGAEPGDGETPEQKAERERLDRELRNAERAAARSAGRVRKLAEQAEALAARRAQTGVKLTAAQEKLAQLKDEYPEIVNPVTEALESLSESVKDLHTAEEERRTEAQADVAENLKEQEAIFLAEHPDAKDVLAKVPRDELLGWMLDQPARIRAAYYANENSLVDGKAAATFLSAYKAAHSGNGPTPSVPPIPTPTPTPTPDPSLAARRERQLSAIAAPVGNRRVPTPSGIPKSAATNEEIWNAIEAQERAEAQGR